MGALAVALAAVICRVLMLPSGTDTAKPKLSLAQPSLSSPDWKQHATFVKALSPDGIDWHLLHIPSCPAKA